MLKEILANLPKQQMDELMVAFEQGASYIVHLKDAIVAVNYTGFDFEIKERSGAWFLLERKNVPLYPR